MTGARALLLSTLARPISPINKLNDAPPTVTALVSICPMMDTNRRPTTQAEYFPSAGLPVGGHRLTVTAGWRVLRAGRSKVRTAGRGPINSRRRSDRCRHKRRALRAPVCAGDRSLCQSYASKPGCICVLIRPR